MAMNKHSLNGNGGVGIGGTGDGSGGLTPEGADSQTDLLAGLELGKKAATVSCFAIYFIHFGYIGADLICRTRRRGRRLYHLHLQRIRPYYPSSPVNETGSASVMQN